MARALDAEAEQVRALLPPESRAALRGLAVGRLPAYHDKVLDGWAYLDARRRGRRLMRPA